MSDKPPVFMTYAQARERLFHKKVTVVHWLLQWGWASFESIQTRLDLHRSGTYRLLATMEKEGYIVKDKSSLATRWRLTRAGRLLFKDQPLREKRQVAWATAEHDDRVQIVLAKTLHRFLPYGSVDARFLGTNGLARQYPSQGELRRPDALFLAGDAPYTIEYERVKKSSSRRREMFIDICKRCEAENSICWLIVDSPTMVAAYEKTRKELLKRVDLEYHLMSMSIGLISQIHTFPLPAGTEIQKAPIKLSPQQEKQRQELLVVKKLEENNKQLTDQVAKLTEEITLLRKQTEEFRLSSQKHHQELEELKMTSRQKINDLNQQLTTARAKKGFFRF